MSHREVSAQEAVYRILSLPLKLSSRDVVFINSSMKNVRPGILKPNSVLKNLNDEDEDVFASSIHDKYAARPNSLEKICLADFASTYRIIYKSNIANERHEEMSQENILETEENKEIKCR